MRKRSILVITGVLLFNLTVFGQSKSSNTLKKEYPKVYNSIADNANKQWGNHTKVKQDVIDAETSAFYSMMSMRSWDWEALSKAVITYSYPGTQGANEKILKDFSIQNPLPLLKCDWYKVKVYYDKIASENKIANEAANTYAYNNQRVSDNRISGSPRQTEPVKEVTTNHYANQQENSYSGYVQEREYTTDYYTYDKSENTQGYRFGLKAGVGMSTVVDASSNNKDAREKDVNPGLAMEIGIVNLYRNGNFFVQNETTISRIQYTYKYSASQGYSNSYDYKKSHLFLQNSIHAGGYARMDENMRFVAGLGGFVGGRLESKYKRKEGNTETKGVIRSYMKGFNLGISGLVGVEKDNFRVALYPSLGLTKMTTSSNEKTLNLLLGVTYWL
ncbi:MAG: hypothetical protein E6772_00945 [Dysgonomonas sp.]|nr:hypothetical protein [Dysgonomonas sp.]